MASLQKETDAFEQRREEFAENHHGEVVVIHGTEVAGFFESEREAYLSAKEKFGKGSFLIRRCLRADEERPAIFHSRVA